MFQFPGFYFITIVPIVVPFLVNHLSYYGILTLKPVTTMETNRIETIGRFLYLEVHGT